MKSSSDKDCPACFGTGKTINQKKVGRIVRGLRNRLGVSQTELARALGVHASNLCFLEEGRRRWTGPLFNRALEWLEEKEMKSK